MATAQEVYQRTRKPHDKLWNTWVARPLASVVVAAVADAPISPNQITFVSFFVAMLGAAVLLLVPGWVGVALGVLVLEAAYVLDCADGMLARWRGTASPAGHQLDFTMDELKAFALVACVTARQAHASSDTTWLLSGLFLLLALAASTSLTKLMRDPQVLAALDPSDDPAEAPPTDPLVEDEVPPPQRSDADPEPALAVAMRLAERGAAFVIHYPSWIWAFALVGDLAWFLRLYGAVITLYLARTLLLVVIRFGPT